MLCYSCRAIAICFLTGGLILVLSSMMYLLGSLTQKLCNDLAPSEYTFVQRLVDDPDVWDGNTLIGTLLSAQTGINTNISLTGVLRYYIIYGITLATCTYDNSSLQSVLL